MKEGYLQILLCLSAPQWWISGIAPCGVSYEKRIFAKSEEVYAQFRNNICKKGGERKVHSVFPDVKRWMKSIKILQGEILKG